MRCSPKVIINEYLEINQQKINTKKAPGIGLFAIKLKLVTESEEMLEQENKYQ